MNQRFSITIQNLMIEKSEIFLTQFFHIVMNQRFISIYKNTQSNFIPLETKKENKYLECHIPSLPPLQKKSSKI